MSGSRKIVLLLFATIYSCYGYKILAVFPIPGTSHSILGEAFVRPLLAAGHEVTYISPIPIKSPPPKLRQIDVSPNFNVMPTDEIFNIEKLLRKEVNLLDMSMLFYVMADVANSTLLNENVQRLMLDPHEKFDVVIAEWMYNDIYSGLGSVFNCPLIWSSSMEAHFLVLSLIDEDPNPAYSADIISSETPPYTFLQRVKRLWTYVDTRMKQWLSYGKESEIFDKAYREAVAKRGHKYIPLAEARYTGSLMFGNSHVSSGQPIRLPQNYIPIAGYHINSDVKPLPEDLQKIMDNASNGVIYFSMGSLLKSTSIPQELKKGILDMFAELKQTVIWKFEEKISDLPKNVHVVQWAPQQSILAHPKCVLFITHGGLLSTTEALHFGVPIIGIPMFADQFVNVNRAVEKGFARKIDLDFETPVNLKTAIEDILRNPRYQEKIKELSFVYHHRPASPRAQIVHWTEHVVRTRGARHLRSFALNVPLYQKLYLDLLVLLLSTLIIIVYAARKIFTSVAKKERSSRKKEN